MAREAFREGGRKSDIALQTSSVLPLKHRELIKSCPQTTARTREATGYESVLIQMYKLGVV